MKVSSLCLLACTSAPLLFAFALPADDLSFHPAANSDFSKTLKVNLEMNITDASMTMNGEPLPGEAVESLKSNSLTVDMLVGVTEKYVASKDNKPVELLRTYDKMKLDSEFGDESKEMEEFKELEGKTVSFKWNEKESSYDKSFHESEGEKDLLKSLEVDMDLRCLLPEKKVAKGDTWEVPADHLKTLFMPGGLATKGGEKEAGAEFEKIQKNLEEQFSSALKDFKVTCTYKGTKDEGGVTVAEIGLLFDGKAKMDLASMLEDIFAAQKQEGMPDMDFKAGVGMGMKGDGTLLWNMSAGRMQNFEMNATANLDVDINVHAEQGDQPIDVVMTGRAEGKMTWDFAPTTAAATKK